jgi:hypothetical protein
MFMRLAVLVLAVFAIGVAGCDSGSTPAPKSDDHKGHNHKPGEKH